AVPLHESSVLPHFGSVEGVVVSKDAKAGDANPRLMGHLDRAVPVRLKAHLIRARFGAVDGDREVARFLVLGTTDRRRVQQDEHEYEPAQLRQARKKTTHSESPSSAGGPWGMRCDDYTELPR